MGDETPTKSRPTTRRSKIPDADYRPPMEVHVVRSPVVVSKDSPAPQSPAFATRSRLRISEKVNKLSSELEGLLKKSGTRASARKFPTLSPKRVRMIRLDADEKPKSSQEILSQESVLAEALPESQEMSTQSQQEQIKSPQPAKKLTTRLIMRALEEEETNEPALPSSEAKTSSGESENDSEDGQEQAENEGDEPPQNENASSSDESDKYFSIEDTAANKTSSGAEDDESDAGDKDASMEELGMESPVEPSEDKKLLSAPFVLLEKIQETEIPAPSSGDEKSAEEAPEPVTPVAQKKRKSSSFPASQEAVQDLVDLGLKVISMELNAVVCKKDGSTGRAQIANIKIRKSGSPRPSTSISPVRSPLHSKLSKSQRQDLQKKAMLNWSVTDTEDGSETTESEEQAPRRLGTKVTLPELPKIPRQASKSPEKMMVGEMSPRDASRSPSKSPMKLTRVESPKKISPEKPAVESPPKGLKSPERAQSASPVKSLSKRSECASPEKLPKKLKIDQNEPEPAQEPQINEDKEDQDGSDEEIEMETNGHSQENESEEEEANRAEEENEAEEESDAEEENEVQDESEVEEQEIDQEGEGDNIEAEDSDDAPEEVSVQASKKAVSKMMSLEIEAKKHLSQVKKEKRQKREEQIKEEKQKKIELLPSTVIDQLQPGEGDLDAEEKTKKKKKKKKRRKNKLAQEESETSENSKRKKFDEDFISLKVDGPTKFGLMPLDGLGQNNAIRHSTKYKTKRNNRIKGKEAKMAREKMKASAVSVPSAYKGDAHFY